MISDADLQRMLELTADRHNVPGDGVGLLLAERDRLERPAQRQMPWISRLRWVPVAVVAVAVLLGVGLVLVQQQGGGGDTAAAPAVARPLRLPLSPDARTSPRTRRLRRLRRSRASSRG